MDGTSFAFIYGGCPTSCSRKEVCRDYYPPYDVRSRVDTLAAPGGRSRGTHAAHCDGAWSGRPDAGGETTARRRGSRRNADGVPAVQAVLPGVSARQAIAAG